MFVFNNRENYSDAARSVPHLSPTPPPQGGLREPNAHRLIHPLDIVKPQCGAYGTYVSPTMTAVELDDCMRWSLRSMRPFVFFYGHDLALAVFGIICTVAILEIHARRKERLLSNITLMYVEACAFLPSIGCLLELVYNCAYALSRNVAVSILGALLQNNSHFRHIPARYCLHLGEPALTDTVGGTGEANVVV